MLVCKVTSSPLLVYVGITSEIHAHHHQTLFLVKKNQQLAKALELMREVSSGSSDQVMTIFENNQKQLSRNQEQLMRLRSILQKYTSNLSTGTESNAPSTTSTEGDTDGRNTTSIVHIATNTYETLIDNERSLQFARLSLLSEKKDLELKIDGGGLQLNEVKALKHRIKSLNKCIYQYDSRIQTTKEEYEAIRGEFFFTYSFELYTSSFHSLCIYVCTFIHSLFYTQTIWPANLIDMR